MKRFSVGRATALVLDSGAGVTSAVPVYDGYVLKKGKKERDGSFVCTGPTHGCLWGEKGILRQSIAGDLISQQILDYLRNERQLSVLPQYKIASKKAVESGQAPEVEVRERPNTTESYDHYQISVCFVCVCVCIEDG